LSQPTVPDVEPWPFVDPAYLQPASFEELDAAFAISVESPSVRVTQGFKARCSFGSCRGFVGYVLVRRGVNHEPVASFEPLRGWRRDDDGLWRLRNRARKQSNRGLPLEDRRVNPLYKGLTPTEFDATLRDPNYTSDSFRSRPGPRTMLASSYSSSGRFGGGHDVLPTHAQCPDCGRVLRIEAPGIASH
jgi:hypothetical protein